MARWNISRVIVQLSTRNHLPTKVFSHSRLEVFWNEELMHAVDRSVVMAYRTSGVKVSVDADPSDCSPSESTTPQPIKTKRKPTIIKF